jgi:hypothetical protein
MRIFAKTPKWPSNHNECHCKSCKHGSWLIAYHGRYVLLKWKDMLFHAPMKFFWWHEDDIKMLFI